MSKKRYFEGWYFKQVSQDQSRVLSIIPGISLGQYRHAFVQVLDGITGASDYFEYDISDFQSKSNVFDIKIGSSRFTENGLTLDINQQNKSVRGTLKFSGLTPYPARFLSPGVMSWYSFVPFMECYHGVLSMTHRVDGTVDLAGKTMDFTSGKGYAEKDWGTSFPECWVWVQSNHFQDEGVSFMLSAAKIPWLCSMFPGFLSFLRLNSTLYTFATYTGARLTGMRDSGKTLRITVEDKRHRLDLEIRAAAAAILKAPRAGNMERHIKESVDSEIILKLSKKNGATLFEGKGVRAGFEKVGEVVRLFSE